MSRKNAAAIRRTVYATFRGADFSTDPSLVEHCRSPLCTNIVADGGGMPQKRCGWRTLHEMGDTVWGLFSGEFAGGEMFLAHVGTHLYKWTEDGTPTELLSGLPEHKSRGAMLAGKLWIVTGNGFFEYDGVTARRVTDDPEVYVPTTVITRMPTGGGVSFEDVNMLTPRRKNAFQTDGTAVSFLLDSPVDESGTVRAWVWGAETADFTVDRASGTVTFESAPPAPEAGQADGLVIEFPHTVEGYAERINACTILTTYGLGNNDRLVLSGDAAFPSRDYTSAMNDPTYFPDLSYASVGENSGAIMGYCRIGARLGIVKRDHGEDSTIYLRSAASDSEGNALFPLQQAVSGVGAVSPGSFAVLLDDPLFLAKTGVTALTTNAYTSEKLAQGRSFYLNARLTKEEDPGEAEAIVWDGMYLLAFPNGHVYCLDGRQQKTYRSAALGDFVYEGYYWENIPALCWMKCPEEDGEALYFGTADGHICRFNSDIDTMLRYSDDGEAIDAVWATKYDDDGTPATCKTMLKRGCCVTIKPYARSSATVFFRSDKTNGEALETAFSRMDILNFSDIDFERFTFFADDSPQEIFLNRKVRKYKRLQILVRNSEVNEGFGIFQITKHYVTENYAKR